MSDPFEGIDLVGCEARALRAAEGDAREATDLVEDLWPALQRLVRSQRSLGPLGKNEDHVHDVLAKVVEKLCARDGRALKLYVAWRARHDEKTFADWLRIVAKNVARDHVREKLGDSRGAERDRDPSVKRILNEVAASPLWERIGVRPPMTRAQTARQLLEWAGARLPADQYGALTRWIEGASFEEMVVELGLPGADDARKLLRAAVATLRRHFVTDLDGEAT